ncbi:MAG: Spy/CpxP family protein refolding chaperone [Desulfomonilaceae bacterium]
MRRKALTTFCAATLAVVLMASGAFAGHDGHQWRHVVMCGLHGIWNDLTKPQRDQIVSMQVDLIKKVTSLKAELGTKRAEMLQLVTKDNPDETAIEKKREEFWTTKDAIRAARRSFTKQLGNVLTPEQKKKMRTVIWGSMCQGFNKP